MSDEESWLLDADVEDDDAPQRIDPAQRASTSMLTRVQRHLERHDADLALSTLADAVRAEPEVVERPTYWLLRTAAWSQRASNATSGSDAWLTAADEAIRASVELQRIDPDNVRGLVVSAEANATAGFLARAEQLVLEALRLAPSSPDPYAVYADVLTRAGETDAALAVIARGLQIDPEDQALLTARRDAMYVAEDPEWSDANRRLLAADPMNAEALHMAAVDAKERGDHEGATTHARSAAREMPGSRAATEQARHLAAIDHWTLRPVRPILVMGMSWWIWLLLFFGSRLVGVAVAGPEQGRAVGFGIFFALLLYMFAWPSFLEKRSRP